MLKHAYQIGVLRALEEGGFLEKQAGATHGLKAIAEGALGKMKRYFTGAGVREALSDYATVSKSPVRGIPLHGAEAAPVIESMTLIEEYARGLTGNKAESILKDVAARLKHAIPSGVKGQALKQVGKSLLPYAVPAAGVGLAAATPAAMEAIYPNF